MPTVNAKRDRLFELIGQKFTDEEFRTLCFEFGIELDDITSEREMKSKMTGADAGGSDAVIYKIDIPANRYDLLCTESLAMALSVFLKKKPTPKFIVQKPSGPAMRIVRKKETKGVREEVVGAVLRGVTFTQDLYDSFIDLQDKLHQNIGRRRTLVSIGTHDLDTIQGPFTYEGRSREEIRFVALNETKEMDVNELYKHYAEHKERSHLRPYLNIIEEGKPQPVFYDKNRVLLSVPPVINGNHSKISLATKNIFIEATGTDRTKLHIALQTIVAAFSEFCSTPFAVEQVEIVDEETGATELTPTMDNTIFKGVSVDYITTGIGVPIAGSEMATLLERMQLSATLGADGKTLDVSVPVTRSDILHPCDILEDVAIAYGYNRLPRTIPNVPTLAQPQPLNKLSDLVRDVIAQAGFSEVLTWALCSHDENFTKLGLTKPEQQVGGVRLANAKTQEFQMVRTTLIAGLLKVLASNKSFQLPIRLFEVSDVMTLDERTEVGARNHRRVGAAYCGTGSGLEHIHGLLDRVLHMLDARWVSATSPEAVAAEAAVAANGGRLPGSKDDQRQVPLWLQYEGKPFKPQEEAPAGTREARHVISEGEKDEKAAAAAVEEQKSADKAADSKSSAEGKKGKDAKKGKGGKDEKKPAVAAEEDADVEEEKHVQKYKGIYYYKSVEHPTFFPGRCAAIFFNGLRIGTFGVVHPSVLTAYELSNPVSVAEFDLEPFLDLAALSAPVMPAPAAAAGGKAAGGKKKSS